MSTRSCPTPDDPLTDGTVTLRLVRDDPADPARERVRALRFEILDAASGMVAGQIDLRLGLTEALRVFGGNIGYEVHPEWRGRRFAARACRLLVPIAHGHGCSELWLTCDPDNVASRRTCERIGAELIDVIELPPEGATVRRKCRFRWRVSG